MTVPLDTSEAGTRAELGRLWGIMLPYFGVKGAELQDIVHSVWLMEFRKGVRFGPKQVRWAFLTLIRTDRSTSIGPMRYRPEDATRSARGHRDDHSRFEVRDMIDNTNGLDAWERQLLRRVYVDGETRLAIGKDSGMSNTTVGMHVRHALEKMRATYHGC